MKQVVYREGYKYQLAEDYGDVVDVHPPETVSTRFIRLDPDGSIWIRQDYAWDGPSGPTYDTPDSMRGSLVHDALYQLMREGLLDRGLRALADREFHRILIEDGMPAARAGAWYLGVRLGAGPAAEPPDDALVMRAP